MKKIIIEKISVDGESFRGFFLWSDFHLKNSASSLHAPHFLHFFSFSHNRLCSLVTMKMSVCSGKTYFKRGKDQFDLHQTLAHSILFMPPQIIPFITALQVHHHSMSKNLLDMNWRQCLHLYLDAWMVGSEIVCEVPIGWHEIWHYPALKKSLSNLSVNPLDRILV